MWTQHLSWHHPCSSDYARYLILLRTTKRKPVFCRTNLFLQREEVAYPRERSLSSSPSPNLTVERELVILRKPAPQMYLITAPQIWRALKVRIAELFSASASYPIFVTPEYLYWLRKQCLAPCSKGTLRWMSPEMIATCRVDDGSSERAEYSQAVDLYSFGIIMCASFLFSIYIQEI